MRELSDVELSTVTGGDDNTLACQTAVGATTFVVGATYGLQAGAAVASVGTAVVAACETGGTYAGQAIASGISGASESIDAFGSSLADAYGALQMTLMRGTVNWLMVDGL